MIYYSARASMSRLWLTYAWKDNEDQSVDYIICELGRAELDVRYDRVQLLAGRGLWSQIDAAMNDPAISAWAMFVTEASLKSEPCQEEIAYALDRAIRSGRANFPLIGIFPAPIDRSLIPSAIATRLYVNLRDPHWVDQIKSGVTGTRHSGAMEPPNPFGHKLHDFNGIPVLEVWPLAGRWFPFFTLVPASEAAALKTVMYGPRDGVTGNGMVSSGDIMSDDGLMKGKVIDHQIDAVTSAHIFLERIPSKLIFGCPNGPRFVMEPT